MIYVYRSMAEKKMKSISLFIHELVWRRGWDIYYSSSGQSGWNPTSSWFWVQFLLPIVSVFSSAFRCSYAWPGMHWYNLTFLFFFSFSGVSFISDKSMSPSLATLDQSHSPITTTTVLTAPCPDATKPADGGWNRFKQIGDNIEKTVRWRHQRIDCSTLSLHYFNSLALKDRVNSLCLDDKWPSISLKDLSAESLLPSDEDLQQIRANFGILIGGVLTEYLYLHFTVCLMLLRCT